ncbi:MAG: outer membrane protein assembly factor BamD [Elusimicrobia bacterium]|nr:outer membrane protein assembly factor BamD [Elusimicrobiota bacterium]
MVKLKHLLLFPALIAAAGCVATQHDMLQMQSQMDDLNTNLNNMQKNQADLAVKMDNLSTSLNVFSESLKDITSRMEKLSSRLDEVDSGMNKRVNAIGQTIKKQQEEVETALLPAKIYNDAYSAFLNNNFDASVSGFKNYLSRFPAGDMAEGAYYYLGESLYLKGHWKEAAMSYGTTLEKYPKSQRVPVVRLKYALSILKLPEDKKGEAISYLQSIETDFPKSAEAKTAREYLLKLNPAKADAHKAKPAHH